MVFRQDTRLIMCTTPVKTVELLLDSFSGEEQLSTLFDFDLRLLSEDENIDPKQLLGQPIGLKIGLALGSDRYFCGLVSEFTVGQLTPSFAEYRARMVPRAWILTRRSDNRIFMDKSVPDIVDMVLLGAGFKKGIHFRSSLKTKYGSRKYCVQYRESDFNFISRLMEEESIYYYFEHTDVGDCIVMVDDISFHEPCPEQSIFQYSVPESTKDEDVITDWEDGYRLRSGRVVVDDFNFKTPSDDLNVAANTIYEIGGNKSLELYDQPFGHRDPDEGDRYARLWMREEEAGHVLCSGESTCRVFSPGYTMRMTEHFRKAANRGYLLHSVSHFGANNYETDDPPGATYTNRFTALPDDVQFGPPRRTPKPVVQGPQTAQVVGPDGEDIYVDKYGRVRVKFHWDRDTERKIEDKSCWIRVSQAWAGNEWGAMYLPRIGQEVIVEFIEGDPDRPVITGRVYNAEHMPPYKLPGNKTVSTIRSMTSKGGDGFNEIRFEDKKGKEQVFLHAQRDQDNLVRRNSTEWIGRNRNLTVKRDQLETVERDKHLSVTGDKSEKVDGTVSLDVGLDVQEKVGMKYAVDSGMEIHLKAGMNVVIEGGIGLTIKVGGNHITINPAGIFISGTMLFLNSGGTPLSGSGAVPNAAMQAATIRRAASAGRAFCMKCAP